MPTQTTTEGDCFIVAAQLAATVIGATLCHGIPTLQGGEHKGKRYWHAWIEVDGTVFDYSNGHQYVMPQEHYYIIGRIAAAEVRRYTPHEMAAMLVSEGHFGPWGDWGDAL